MGTSDKKDAREYFGDLVTHQKEFETADAEDRGLIDMAFSKVKVADRKEWLTTYQVNNKNIKKGQVKKRLRLTRFFSWGV